MPGIHLHGNLHGVALLIYLNKSACIDFLGSAFTFHLCEPDGELNGSRMPGFPLQSSQISFKFSVPGETFLWPCH